MSTEKGYHHHCNYKHEVPSLENRTIPVDQISETIGKIIDVNFKNPPKKFLESIVYICVANKHFPILTKIAENFMKSYADEETLKTYFEIIICSAKSCIKFQNDCIQALESIFSDIITNSNMFNKVLNLVLNTFGNTCERGLHNLPLLRCVEFLKKYNNISYPATFKLAVIKQLMEKVDNKIPSDHTKKFGLKVYYTFLKGKKYDDIYQLDKPLVDRCIEYLEKDCKLYISRNQESTNRNVKNRFHSRVESYHGGIAPLHELIDTVINHPENETCVDLLLRRLGDPDCNYDHVFKLFSQNGDKGISTFIRILKNCTNFLKKKLNNVTMSFILQSVRRNDWDSCYSLYNELHDFDPCTIRHYLNEERRPALFVLLIIRVCLKARKLQEGIKLYFKYDLYKEHSQWPVTPTEEDKDVWKTVLCDIQEALTSNSEPLVISNMLVNLIDKQDSLCQPIDLTDCIADFISKMVAGNWNEESCEFVIPVIDTIVKRRGIKKHLMVEAPFHWRLLIIALVNKGMDDGARALFRKAERRVPSYFIGRNKEKVELCISLTKQEIFIILSLFFSKWSVNTDSMPNLEINFKWTGDNTLDKYIGELNRTVTEAKKRFQSAMVDLGLRMSLLQSKEDQFILDGIVMAECIKQQGTLLRSRRRSPSPASYPQYGAYKTSTNQGNYQRRS